MHLWFYSLVGTSVCPQLPSLLLREALRSRACNWGWLRWFLDSTEGNISRANASFTPSQTLICLNAVMGRAEGCFLSVNAALPVSVGCSDLQLYLLFVVCFLVVGFQWIRPWNGLCSPARSAPAFAWCSLSLNCFCDLCSLESYEP